MPSCPGMALGRRAKITFHGVIVLPRRRRSSQYTSRRAGLDGVSMGVSRMGASRRRLAIAGARSIVQEGQGPEQRAEPDAERDAEHPGHGRAVRQAAAVTMMSSAAGR